MRHYLKITAALFVLAAGLFFLWAGESSYAAEPEIGKPAPDFEFTDVEGESWSLSGLEGKYVVLEWFNHGCPFVGKHYGSGKMQELQKKYGGQEEVVWIAINSTSDGHGDYRTPEQSKEDAAANGTSAEYIVLDPEGEIGKMYGAKTTPHIYIINPERKLIYMGAADSIKSTDEGDIPKATNYIDVTLTEAMAGEAVSEPETKPYGCSVKYK